MADPDPRPRLSLADHALIHTLGYLAIEWPNPTWQTFLAELAAILPRVNRDIHAIADMATTAEALLSATKPSETTMFRDKARGLIGKFHQARAANAIDELRRASMKEPA